MSYCRWSDNNWKSDIYAYESEVGFVVHVATHRVAGDVPEVPFILDVGPEEYFEKYKAQMDFLEKAERVPINGPCDGETFCYKTVQELYDGLRELQVDGYVVPEFAFEEIKQELEGNDG